MNVEDEIENAELLRNIFGGWPSFHDAEIVSMRLARGSQAPFLEAAIHLFKTTSDIDAQGFYVLAKHTLATIRFSGITRCELEGFNHQNSIDGLGIQQVDGEGRLTVRMLANNGCDARFNCDSIAVVDVSPFVPRGAPV